MGTVANLIANWTSGNPERVLLYKNTPDLVLRWINEAQVRFVDYSECLQDIWEPIMGSDGVVDLPDDFLREIPDRVKWDANTVLQRGDYGSLNILSSNISSAEYYAIWGGKFYVFAPSDGTPSIPYIKKPMELLIGSINTDDLEIPSEYHLELTEFLDAMWARMTGDVSGSRALMEDFKRMALACGNKFSGRRSPVPMMRGGML